MSDIHSSAEIHATARSVTPEFKVPDEIDWIQLMTHVDINVMYEVALAHHRGSFLRASAVDNRRFMPSLEDAAPFMTRDTHLTQGGPFIPLTANAPAIEDRRSPPAFSESEPLDMATVSTLFNAAFRADPATRLRPYPSGGRLYPVEVFLVDLTRRQEAEPLHYLHNRHAFERVVSDCTDWRMALMGPDQPWGTPSAGIVYVVNLPKTVVKYRHRGYRLALIEAGAMMQEASRAIMAVGLRDRITNTFSDHQLSICLGLNPACFLPVAVQLVGAARASDMQEKG